MRDNDEGYVDINLALNALEAVYIQLTGKVEMKKKFFPKGSRIDLDRLSKAGPARILQQAQPKRLKQGINQVPQQRSYLFKAPKY